MDISICSDCFECNEPVIGHTFWHLNFAGGLPSIKQEFNAKDHVAHVLRAVLLIIAAFRALYRFIVHLSFCCLSGFIVINFCRNFLKSTLTIMQRTVFHLFADFVPRYMRA